MGYMHKSYAEALAEFGTPRELPRSGGWILVRSIPGFPDRDAMGCYPLFACRDWSQLAADLESVSSELVSLALVTDTFGEHDPAQLRQCFDVVFPFKEHFVADLARPASSFVSSHHCRNALKAVRGVAVEICEAPSQFLDDWDRLYTTLVERHNIRGISRFSRASFARQLEVPGLVMFRAIHQATTVGIILWYVQGQVGYYHLGAYSDLGYELRASFALFWRALEYFAGRLRWLSLGAGAGVTSRADDGLTRFKRGWSTETRPVYFCGRIFDSVKYAEIVSAKGFPTTNYFPAYRKGEFS
jgi:hypothetical protein